METPPFQKAISIARREASKIPTLDKDGLPYTTVRF